MGPAGFSLQALSTKHKQPLPIGNQQTAEPGLVFFPALLASGKAAKGGRKNKTGNRRTSAPARKKKYARAFFFLDIFLGAFLGVSRQGEFENTGNKLSTFPKK
jgi:hypothetical protein